MLGKNEDLPDWSVCFGECYRPILQGLELKGPQLAAALVKEDALTHLYAFEIGQGKGLKVLAENIENEDAAQGVDEVHFLLLFKQIDWLKACVKLHAKGIAFED